MDTQDKVVAMTPATITISKEQFDDAVADAVVKTVEEMEKEGKSGMATLIIPMTGTSFANTVRDILFGDEEENNGEE